jgi:hypothetical protein
LLGQDHAEAPAGRVTRDAAAVDATTDDEKVADDLGLNVFHAGSSPGAQAAPIVTVPSTVFFRFGAVIGKPNINAQFAGSTVHMQRKIAALANKRKSPKDEKAADRHDLPCKNVQTRDTKGKERGA